LVSRKGMVTYRGVGMVEWTGIAATSVVEKLLTEM
jgi:hypothetical protein